MPDALVLRASRLKWTVVLAASLVFVSAGLLILLEAPNGRVAGIAVILFFGLGAVVAVLQMATGRLELSPAGFTISGLGRKSTTRWSEVSSAAAVRPAGAGMKMVQITLSDSGHLHAAADVGGRRLLPDTYGMRAEDLAALMNEWHDRYALRKRA